jgi:Nif-specific regulatory protein
LEEGLTRLEREWLTAPAPDVSEMTTTEASRRVARLEALLQVTSRISRFLEIGPLLDQILDAVLEISKCDRAFILLADEEGRLHFVSGRDRERNQVTLEQAEISFSRAQRAFRSGRPVWDEGLGERARTGESIDRLSLETVICLPLLGSEQALGVLYLDSRTPGELLRSEDLPIMEAFAGQAAIAVEKARLHEQVARQRDTLALENTVLRREVEQAVAFDNIVGRSPPMRKLFALMERVKDVDTPVLIVGETGTGKDLIAKAIHFHGHRAQGPFVPANCGAMSEQLDLSTLFGHRKGAFTGAIEDKAGLFELANEGTLFLDEIGELAPSIQTALLRVLQDGVITRLGEEHRPRRVDVRLIYATNRNLEEMVRAGRFREDLFYRLNVIRLEVPPLRERGEDIRLLAEHFRRTLSEKLKRPVGPITKETYRLFYDYSWPGNVRELEKLMERAIVLADPGAPLTPDLFDEIAPQARRRASRYAGGLKDRLLAAEKEILEEALEACGWNVSECARRLGCTRQHLHNRMRRLRIQRPARRS